MNAPKREPAIVLFDGECNLCDGLVQFLIQRDATGERFRYAAQQSEAGRALLAEQAMIPDLQDTIVVIADGKRFTHSDAALAILRRMPFPWSLLSIGIILPKPIRDYLYRFVAKNRYRWFGKRDQCMLPTPERKARFLT